MSREAKTEVSQGVVASLAIMHPDPFRANREEQYLQYEMHKNFDCTHGGLFIIIEDCSISEKFEYFYSSCFSFLSARNLVR